MNFYFVIDFEATCDEPKQTTDREIIEFPIVLYQVGKGIIAEFRQFVKPNIHPTLTDFCRNLTGISQEDVDHARPFSDVYNASVKWIENCKRKYSIIEEDMTMVTCGKWDLAHQLPLELRRDPTLFPSQDFQTYVNLKDLFCERFESVGKTRDLDIPSMLQTLECEFEGHLHSGIDDCRNMATILSKLVDA